MSYPNEPRPFVSQSCEGERCFCGHPAEHKVEETIFDDDPVQPRHPLTSYICHRHFLEIMGPAADRFRSMQGDPPSFWPATWPRINRED